jgi:hypothetical protein
VPVTQRIIHGRTSEKLASGAVAHVKHVGQAAAISIYNIVEKKKKKAPPLSFLEKEKNSPLVCVAALNFQ